MFSKVEQSGGLGLKLPHIR